MAKKISSTYEQLNSLHEKVQQQRPLGATATRKMLEYYRVGMTYASNALEGNTLTLAETKIVIEDGLTVGGKPMRDHLEAIGHAAAFDQMQKLARRKTITEPDILELHEIFYRTIDAETAGIYRTVKVFITGSEFVPPSPSNVPRLMKEMIRQSKEMRKNLHPVAFAAWLHLQFVTIHPFIDGNGRTARLLMNLALIQAGYPLAIIPPIRRQEYMWTLQREQMKQIENPTDSFEFFVAGLVKDALQDYLRMFEL